MMVDAAHLKVARDMLKWVSELGLRAVFWTFGR
jgi:hypothetical protein